MPWPSRRRLPPNICSWPDPNRSLWPSGPPRRAAGWSGGGGVLVGEASGTAFGDYIAGSNHVLPTNGAARFASALSPAHFRRRFSVVRISEDAPALARAAAPLARAEGFEVHARSMEARIRQNG